MFSPCFRYLFGVLPLTLVLGGNHLTTSLRVILSPVAALVAATVGSVLLISSLEVNAVLDEDLHVDTPGWLFAVLMGSL